MSNNNKQPPDLTESLPIFEKAQAPSTTTPTVNKLDLTDSLPREKNDSLDIFGTNQPDARPHRLTGSHYYSNRLGIPKILKSVASHSDEAMVRLYYVDSPPSICKVSRILRDLSESSFNPLLVSIGPIHSEDPNLKEFESLKECYLDDLLNRSNSTAKETILEACLLKVNTLIPEIKKSYGDVVIKNYSNVELARMMVIDGCFILEFCFKHEEENLYLPNKMQNRRIAMDLMLLENQVPFFVLQALFDCFMDRMLPENKFTLSDVLDTHLAPYIKLFRSQCREEIPTTYVDPDSTHDHVLGYLHKRYHLLAAKLSMPKHAEASKPVDEELAAKSWNPVDAEAFRGHTIVELDRSGMNFKPHQVDEWSMNIKYQSSSPIAYLPSWFPSKPATLLMPTLVIQDTTELILRNFIAYEQSFPHVRYYFTSYAHAMDMLIDTQEDIAKLVESKVLDHKLGSNQEAADMINKLCKNMFVTDFYYIQAFEQMDKYYNSKWPKKIASLRRNFERQRRVYFNNPWNIFALLGAIILFSLTVVQTIYTIRAA